MKLKNVLVTGASTGIGKRITEHLSMNGFKVFAGARKAEDIADLSNLKDVTGVRLDVTSKEDIEACVKLIKQSGGLFALVNNAGIGDYSPLLEMDEDSYNFLLDVNLIAANRLFQHFFEQLHDNKGRIVNISSISGFTIPGFLGAYNISKIGLIAYSEQLNSELTKFGINVSSIEPAYFNSAIHEKFDRMFEKIKNTTKYYREEYWAEKSTDIQDEYIKDPIQVAERVYHSLTTEKPHTHYTVGNRNEEGWVFEALFNRISAINNGLKEPWTLDELHDMFNKLIQNS